MGLGFGGVQYSRSTSSYEKGMVRECKVLMDDEFYS